MDIGSSMIIPFLTGIFGLIIGLLFGFTPTIKKKLSYLNDPFLLTIFSALCGTILGLSSSFIITDSGQQLLFGLTSSIFVLLISDLWRVSQKTPKLSTLERSLSNNNLFNFIEKIINAHQKFVRINKEGRFELFFNEKLESLYTSVAKDFVELSEGKIIIHNPDRELTLITEAMDLAERNICAVSYQDEEFWNNPHGEDYLKKHKELIDNQENKIKITRIFIPRLAEIWTEKQVKIIEQQSDIGIETFILPIHLTEPKDCEDFVLYDDKFVRYAKIIGNSATLKRATLSCNPEEVAEYINKYKNLKCRSIPGKEFIASFK